MKKRWIRVIIVAFVLMILEVVGAMFFLKPYVTKYQLFDNISKGKWAETKENFDKLNPNNQEYVKKQLNAYASFLCMEYLNGDKSYLNTMASFDAINMLDTKHEIYDEYVLKVSENELRKVIIEYHAANAARNSEKIYKCQKTIQAIMQRVDSNTREAFMISFLKEEYAKFLDEQIDAETIWDYASIVTGMSYYEAYALSFDIISNIEFIASYREEYNEINALCDNKEYLEVLQKIDSVLIDPNDKLYAQRFKTLRDNAYTLGKLYYEELLNGYVASGDNASAVALMAQLEDVYGDDFDVSGAQESLASDWQKAYITFIADWEDLLKRCIEDSSAESYIMGERFDKIWPDSACLYDINDNGTPELFLFNSARLDEKYVPCFILTTDGPLYSYVGFVNLIALCSDSNMITYSTDFGSDTVEGYVLTAFNGENIGTTDSCQKTSDKYYVNGSETKDTNYLTAKTALLAHQGADALKYLGYASLDEAKSYVLTFK